MTDDDTHLTEIEYHARKYQRMYPFLAEPENDGKGK